MVVERSGAGHPLLRAVAAGIGAVFVLWVATVGLVLLAGSRAILRPADVIMVLGAAQYNGRPSPVLKARLDYALALYQRGLAPRMVFTGGVGRGDTVSEAEVARRYALAHGVPERAILVERMGVTSALSIFAASRVMRQRGLRSALLVSDPFHMARVELLALRAGLRPYPAPTPMSRIEQAPEQRWRYVLRESVLFPATALLGAN
jgi:uncharacterized SAM-binding protein YcdF (DUF218 family)